MNAAEVLDVKLGRLRSAAQHRDGEPVISDGVVLLATREPVDGLGRSVLGHYCSDLRRIALRMNYMHDAPGCVNKEGVRWACRMVVTYKDEPVILRHGGEVLRRCCKHNPSMSMILKELGIISLIQILLDTTLATQHRDTDRIKGMLSMISALCCSKHNAPSVSSIPNLVEFTTQTAKDYLAQQPPITITALKSLTCMATTTSIQTMLSCGATHFALSLITPKHKNVALGVAAATYISTICTAPSAAAMLGTSNVVSLLLNVVKTSKHEESKLVMYKCLRDVCVACGSTEGCHVKEELKKQHALQIILRSIGHSVSDVSTVALLATLSVVTETAKAYLSLAFLGLNILIDVLSGSLATRSKAVSVAACRVILVSLKEQQTLKLFGVHACTAVIDALTMYQAEKDVLVLLLQLCAVLSGCKVFRDLLNKVAADMIPRILEADGADTELCLHVASCAINLASNDDLMKLILPRLVDVTRASENESYVDKVVELMGCVCKTEDDREYMIALGGLDLILDRALSRGALTPLFTIKSLRLFACSPNTATKDHLIRKGVLDVLLTIYHIVSNDPPQEFVDTIKSMMVHPDGEAFIMDSHVHNMPGPLTMSKAYPRKFREEDIPLRFTYDDVLLIPKRSHIKSRKDVHTRTMLSRNIELNIPIVASNMDTVCEVDMSIAVARAGGIGILHRFCSIDEQCDMVAKVKRAQSFKIYKPRSVAPDDTVAVAKRVMEYDYGAKYGITSVMVLEPVTNKLMGVLTRTDLQFTTLTADNTKVKDVMVPRSSLIVATDGNISMQEAQHLMHEGRVSNLPVVDAFDRLLFLITATDIMKAIHNKEATVDAQGRLRVGAAVGVKKDDLARARRLVETGCDVLVIDIAHGHSDLEIEMLKLLKDDPVVSKVDIIAGNICTEQAAVDLIAAGADGLKLGVGPGSICITRKVAGSGFPQLSALFDVCPYANANGVPVMADGGIRLSGDVAKALAAGASTVMLGSMLAGTDESPGALLVKDGKKVKVVRGMAGYGANMSKNEREQASNDNIFDMTPEGVEGIVPYKGPVAGILKSMVGGLRSGMSYCGASNLAEMQRNCDFVRITAAGLHESGHHDIAKM